MGYSTVDEVRALDVLSSDPNYTDESIAAGIAWAKSRIDEETGTVWEDTTKSVVLDGTGTNWIVTGVVHLQSVTAATVNDVTVDPVAWICRPDSSIFRPDEVFPYRAGGMNVALTIVHGLALPADLADAALDLARWAVLNDLSTGPNFSNQQVSSEWGPSSAVAYGGRGRPTALPDVNAVLRKHDHRKLFAS